MLTYLDLQNEVLRHLDDAGQETTIALVQDQINRSHRRLLTSRIWPFMLWPREETFTTSENVRTYALHNACGKLLSMWDTTRRSYYPLTPRRSWESLGVDRSNTDLYPLGYIIGPVWPVAAQPLSASTISVVSSSSNDTATTVTIRGIASNDSLVSETVTTSGLTPVSTSASFTNILNVTKGGTWTGTLTLTAGSTTLLSLTASEDGKFYPTIEFVENPQANLPFFYTFQRLPQTLVNDTDIPETWPNELAQIHVYDALLDMSTYNTELGPTQQGLWKRRYDDLYNQLLSASDETVAASLPRFVRDMGGPIYNSPFIQIT